MCRVYDPNSEAVKEYAAKKAAAAGHDDDF